jgi:hypothetical protein
MTTPPDFSRSLTVDEIDLGYLRLIGADEFKIGDQIRVSITATQPAPAKDIIEELLEARSKPPVASFSSFDELMAYLDAPSDPAKDTEEKI